MFLMDFSLAAQKHFPCFLITLSNVSKEPVSNVSNEPISNVSNEPVSNVSNEPVSNVSNGSVLMFQKDLHCNF
jgi:hypothetical protein